MRGVSNPFLALPTNRAAKPGVHRSGNGSERSAVIWCRCGQVLLQAFDDVVDHRHPQPPRLLAGPGPVCPPADTAVPRGCSTDSGITLVLCALQRHFVMPSASITRPARRSTDGQTILRSVRIDPALFPDLVFLVGATGFEPLAPRL